MVDMVDRLIGDCSLYRCDHYCYGGHGILSSRSEGIVSQHA